MRVLPRAARSICATTARCSACPAATTAATARLPSTWSVPARILYRSPTRLPFEHAALIEAVSIAVHAVSLPRPDARRRRRWWSGRHDWRARDPGADATRAAATSSRSMSTTTSWRSPNASVPSTCAEREGRWTCRPRPRDSPAGKGADASFEVVGHTDTVLTAIRSLRKGGTVVLVGNLSPKVEMPLQEVVSREISVARIVRVERRVSAVHRPAGPRRRRRRAAHQPAGRSTTLRMVRAPLLTAKDHEVALRAAHDWLETAAVMKVIRQP